MYRENKDLSETHVVEHPCLPEWHGTIDRAENRGYFSYEEKWQATQWNLCAVGEAYKRGYINSYLHAGFRLSWLGIKFDHQVRHDNFAGCRKTLTKIEKRLNK